MKKLLLLVLSLFVMAFLPVQFVGAAASASVELSKSKSSVVADGSSSVTITVFSYIEGCDNYDWNSQQCVGNIVRDPAKNRDYNVIVSGSNNTISSPTVTTGDDGKASFTLKSTTAETKTIYVTPGSAPTSKDTPITVEFTKPAAKPAPKPAPAPAPAPTPPPSLAASIIKADDQAVTDTQNISIQSDEVFTIGGTTVANGVVKLLIFSDPKEATVTADAQGNWTYDISGLEPGSHHVEAEVTDPVTKLTSQRATLASFTVTEPPTPVIATTPAKKQNFLPYIIAGAALIVAGGAAGAWWYIRKRKSAANISKDQQNQPTNTISPNGPTDSSQQPK